ncbi:unnamed protein product, partial [Ranitomeya imitator]
MHMVSSPSHQNFFETKQTLLQSQKHQPRPETGAKHLAGTTQGQRKTTLQLLKSLYGRRGPIDHISTFLGQINQRFNNTRKISDEAMVKISKAQELLQALHRCRLSPILNGLNFSRVHLDRSRLKAVGTLDCDEQKGPVSGGFVVVVEELDLPTPSVLVPATSFSWASSVPHITTRGCVPTHYHTRLHPHTLPYEASSSHITTRGCVPPHYHTRLHPHTLPHEAPSPTLPHEAASPHITTRGSIPTHYHMRLRCVPTHYHMRLCPHTLPHEVLSPTHYHMRLRPHTLPHEASSSHITTRGCIPTHYHTRLHPHTLPHEASSLTVGSDFMTTCRSGRSFVGSTMVSSPTGNLSPQERQLTCRCKVNLQ